MGAVVQGEQTEAGQEVLVHRGGESLLQKKSPQPHDSAWLRAEQQICVIQ
ncbi:hypothetical protein PDR5_06180 [Pseudomonas sp. DR 5-09]|nr:hypothetical protein PDR5_06180 [Pseudomonas sp. DR 5-09]